MDEPSESAKNGPIPHAGRRLECKQPPQMSCQVFMYSVALEETKAAGNRPGGLNETVEEAES
jgi:hypothetical protein